MRKKVDQRFTTRIGPDEHESMAPFHEIDGSDNMLQAKLSFDGEFVPQLCDAAVARILVNKRLDQDRLAIGVALAAVQRSACIS
jgi:hypothetical protein